MKPDSSLPVASSGLGKRFFGSWNTWMVTTLVVAACVATPILFVGLSVFAPAGEVWEHLAATVLPRYLLNTFWLGLGVGFGTLVVGTGTAWLVTLCRFPGSGFLQWALLLPLAAPTYVLAYAYTDFLQFSGPVQTALRQWFGWQGGDYWFPNVRSLGGAILMLTLVLYTYVYMVARLAFLEQAVCTLEVSRSLGCNPWQSFWRVALPMARPSIMAGLSLALMETLNDYGTVQFFGVDTFTTGIYRTWYGLGERIAATQLAAVLLLLVGILLGLERWSRMRVRYFQTVSQHQHLSVYPLRGIRAWGAVIGCSLPILLGFVIPAGALLRLTLSELPSLENARFWLFARNSLILAGLTAGIAVLLALVMAYGSRLSPHWLVTGANRMAASGYAIPGSVIAVGTLVPVGHLDNTLSQWLQSTVGWQSGLLLSGTIAALIFAYLVRFLSVAYSTVEASLSKIKPSLDEASRSLGHNTFKTLWRIHTPLLGPGLLTAAILVFVDVMKELPASLVIRPFNFDTLAVRAYQLASDERLSEAGAPALAIVVVGLIPVVLLNWRIAQFRQ